MIYFYPTDKVINTYAELGTLAHRILKAIAHPAWLGKAHFAVEPKCEEHHHDDWFLAVTVQLNEEKPYYCEIPLSQCQHRLSVAEACIEILKDAAESLEEQVKNYRNDLLIALGITDDR